MELDAPAKLNLFLFVTGRRPDGYHELFTLFHKVCLSDRVRLAVREGRPGIELETAGLEVPAGPENLAWKAASRFLSASGARVHVSIGLVKVIPSGAGLGGGSSDAAAVLLGLNRLLGAPLRAGEMARIAKGIGADVPFFLLDRPSALGRGIGDRLEPVDLPHRWFLLVKPPYSISTAEVYGNYRLTTSEDATIFHAGYAFEPGKWENHLERVVCSRWPEIGELKQRLLESGAEAALMSGSGSTVFGVFEERAAALEAEEKLGRGYFTAVVESCPSSRS